MQSFLAYSRFASSPLRLAVCALGGPIIALGALSSQLGHERSVVGIVVACLVAALALVPLVPQQVVVGPSSLTLGWITGRREVPFARVASLDTSAGGFAPFVLVTTDGARMPILPIGWSPAFGRAREILAPLAAHLAAR
jgi:hypothetical protein